MLGQYTKNMSSSTNTCLLKITIYLKTDLEKYIHLYNVGCLVINNTAKQQNAYRVKNSHRPVMVFIPVSSPAKQTHR